MKETKDLPDIPPEENNDVFVKDRVTVEKKQAVSLRHKTDYPRYRRAGLVITNQFKPYEVTDEQLKALEKDKWVEVKKG